MLNLLWKINNFKFVALILFFVVAARAAAAENSDHDFNTIFKAVSENSLEYKKIKSDQLLYEAQLQMATSFYYPRLGFEYRYEAFKSDAIDLNGTTSNAVAEWNIFNGFRDSNAKRIAELSLQSANAQLHRFEKNLKAKTEAAYSKAYSLQQSVRFYTEAISANQKNLQSVKLRKQSGLVADSDYLEFELFDSKLKLEFISLQADHQKSLVDLKILANLDTIDFLITDLQPKLAQFKLSEYEKLLTSEKSKLYQSQLAVDVASTVKNFGYAQFLPQVFLKATYGRTGLKESIVNPETVFGITAKWELFSGFDTMAQQKIYAAQLLKAETMLSSDRIHFKNEIQQNVFRLNNIVERLALNLKNPMNVEKYLNTVGQEYRRGVKNSADLKSASELALSSLISKEHLKAEYFELIWNLQEIVGEL